MVEPTIEKERTPKPGVKRINEMSIAYQQAGVLWAGIELELFTRISQGENSPEKIAMALDIEDDAAERLCTSCIALGLIELKNGKYVNSADVERFLVKGKPTYHGDWALFHKNGYEQWKNLATAIKPPKSLYDRIKEDPKTAREITTAGYYSSISAGMKFARKVDLSSYSLLLDLGGGSGVYSIMACQQYPNLHAIIIDFANVCAVADEFIAQAELADRIKTLPGDYLSCDYPKGIDAILICGTLEVRHTQEQKMVLKRVFEALPPGGLLVYITNMLEDDRSGPFEAVNSNLGNVFGPKPWGRIHTASEISGFLAEAGFADLVFSDFAPGTYRMVTAKKAV
jgi:hypothetical protein